MERNDENPGLPGDPGDPGEPDVDREAGIVKDLAGERAAGPATDAGLPNGPDGRYYDERSAEALRGTLTGWSALVALFVRPSRFMLADAVHAKFSRVFLIMWLVGAMGVVGQQEMRAAFPGSRAPLAESWAEIYTLAIAGGLVRGMFHYWLGGLWFRARLWMCGVRRIPPDVAGRVYAHLHLPVAVPSLCVLLVASGAFDSFDEYARTESWWWMGASFVVMALLLYTSVIAYGSVRGVFNAKRVWAVLWFLVLPVAVRAGVFALIFVVAWFAEAAPAPDLEKTRAVSTDTISLRYPGNWAADAPRAQSGPSGLVELTPTGHDAIVAVEIEYHHPGSDPFGLTVGWLEEAGFAFDEGVEPFGRWGGFAGEGRAYGAEANGERYRVRLFYAELGLDAWFAVREVINERSAETVGPGVAFVAGTVAVRDPAGLAPDLSRTVTTGAHGVSFEAPGNWWIERSLSEASEARSFAAAATSPQGSFFGAYMYQSDTPLRNEVGLTLEMMGVSGRMRDERAMDAWLGLEGIGVEGVDTDASGRERRVRVLVTVLADGSYLEVRSSEYLDTASLTGPAFGRFEASFRVED